MGGGGAKALYQTGFTAHALDRSVLETFATDSIYTTGTLQDFLDRALQLFASRLGATAEVLDHLTISIE